jgi:hypothetical protein
LIDHSKERKRNFAPLLQVTKEDEDEDLCTPNDFTRIKRNLKNQEVRFSRIRIANIKDSLSSKNSEELIERRMNDLGIYKNKQHSND